MQLRRARLDSSCIPSRPEVGPAQLGALRPYEYQAALPRLGESVQMPSQLGSKLGREGHSSATRPRLRRLRQQTTLVQLRRGVYDSDLMCLQRDVLLAQPYQLPPSQASECSKQHHGAVADRQRIGDGKHHRQRHDLPFRRMFDASGPNAAWIAPYESIITGGDEDGVQEAIC